ncbi:MAG: response regulator [Longicatena sp.]
MYKVLVVEDEEIIRKGLIFSTNFEKLDCLVVGEAENGQEGIAKIKELKPDIVITDINMPIVNGIEMIESTLDCGISVIIISGFNEFEYAKKAMKYGVSEYLLKPIDMDEMEEAIQHAIEQHNMKVQYENAKENKQHVKNIKVIEITKSEIEKDIVVGKMISYIKDNFAKKIVMQDLCKELNYSEALLNRKFKEYTTYTFNDYLNRYRIQQSVELIKEGKQYLYDVATLCGFTEYKYFSIVFKKYIGCSPNEFIKAIK